MTFESHDEIAEEALGLADRMLTDPRAVHEHLVAWCRREPEKAAQVLMCFAAWTDPDSPDALGDRAEAVAAATAVADERSAVPTFETVILRHDVTTPNGVLPKGSRQRGRPEAGRMWSLWVTNSCVATVPESTVHAGKSHRTTLLKPRDAHEEYEFAREWLGYSHDMACRWLIEHYGTTERQLYRWGLSMTALGVSA
ncbi:hypothetical protein [Nocardia sp. NPDC019255]|uniref:hypothetical protein n=1 Tax=Nocardia sp. NPDC019255 TaxID=3154591 RepID=UPI003401A88A